MNVPKINQGRKDKLHGELSEPSHGGRLASPAVIEEACASTPTHLNLVAIKVNISAVAPVNCISSATTNYCFASVTCYLAMQ